uniref:P/Homo B domain-containing protein n=1 Tax=Mesocestoides corti TaxID=53468 RepID=A0A5K3FGZ7_MESCO
MPVRLIDALSEFKGLDRWPLMSVQFWGEPSAGEWKIIIDNKEGFRKLSAWGNRQPALDKATGQWESVHMVAYGTEIFPIRLKPPKETRQPPKAWFDRFARYVVSEDELSPSEYSCHSECAKNECWGPSSNQCLNGCKNYVTESGQCVASCPAGTTALISMIVMMRRNQSAELNGTRPRLGGQMNELRCERCFSACAECLRPYSAYGCTACSGDSYLAPFLSPPVSETETNLESALLLTADGDKNRVLVGSCVSRCPSGYFANDTSKTCEQCAEHCEECFGPRTDACRRCARNFRLVAGTCVDAAGPHRCPKGSFLQGNICVPCDPGCDLDSCSDYGLCTYCRFDHRFMHEGRCEGVCRPGFYPAFQLSKSGFYATELPVDFTAENGVWVCAPCPPGCARCSPSTKHVQGYVVPMCEVCQTGLILDGDAGTCHSPCPIGTYGGNCSRACHHMCSTCVNELDSCLQCSPGAYLAYGERQLNPLISFTNPKLIGYGCVIFCPEATYVARIDGERVCLPCPPLCKACSAPDKCTRCEEGYAVNELSGKCEPSPLCFHETYFDHIDGKCKPCHPSCASCRGPSPADCLDCRRLRSVLGPSPACLEPSPPVKSANANQDHQSLLEGTILQVTAGTCYLCCGAEKLLDTKPPLDCLFCLPNENTCSSWAAVGGGLGLYENFSFPDGILANSPGGIGGGWAWLTSDPIRLSFFITAVLTIGFALGCLLYQLTITHLRKHHVRDYNLLFLRGAGTGSRLSQRCPDVGNSPVISAQTTSNGLTNGRLPNQRNGDHPSSTSIYHDLLTGVSSVPGNQSLSLTTPLRLFQILHSKIDKNHARPPILTLPQTSYCKYALPFRTTKSSRSSSDKPDYLKVYTLFDDDF